MSLTEDPYKDPRIGPVERWVIQHFPVSDRVERIIGLCVAVLWSPVLLLLMAGKRLEMSLADKKHYRAYLRHWKHTEPFWWTGS